MRASLPGPCGVHADGRSQRIRRLANGKTGFAQNVTYTPTLGEPENPVAKRRDSDSTGMIRGSFLDPESRKDLTGLARDGSVPHRLARWANALVWLDDGMSCEAVARVLLLDDGHGPHLVPAL